MRRFISVSVLLGLACIFCAGSVRAASLCVNPGGAGGCFAAVQAAVNASASGDLIQIASGVYAEHVVIPPNRRIQIVGAGAGSTVLDGSASGTVVTIQGPNAQISLSALSANNGARGILVGQSVRAVISSCEVANNAGEGGIFVEERAKLSVTGCSISNNSNASNSGGGIGTVSADTLNRNPRVSVTGSTVVGNATAGSGGGIFATGKLFVTGTTVRDNVTGAFGLGGGIAGGIMTVDRSTVSGNSSGQSGGGISAFPGNGRATFLDSTISGNQSNGGGGGLHLLRDAVFEHLTVAGNTAAIKGGGVFHSNGLSDRITFKASLIADNTAPAGNDCWADNAQASDGNLIEDLDHCMISASGTAPILSGDPMLGPLQNNGGATETRALFAGSPAIGVVTSRRLCRKPDQRGVARMVPCDLGAFEAP